MRKEVSGKEPGLGSMAQNTFNKINMLGNKKSAYPTNIQDRVAIKGQSPKRGTIWPGAWFDKIRTKSVAPVRLAEAIGADIKTCHRPMTLVHFQCSKRDTNIIIGIHYQLHIRLNIHSSNQFSRIRAEQAFREGRGG
jgi:hypothetical protein